MAHRHRLLTVAVVIIGLAAALALIAAGGGASLAQGDIIHVDADAPGPTHDGSTWDYAYTDLQDALDAAESVAPPVQIWVAEGTYKPTDGADRTISFEMVNEVAIYGGFAGTETELGQRDWDANPTILSGDIGIEDNPDDNSYHVFYHPDGTGLDSTAILDGFTISGGNANGTDPHNRGGGMRNESSSPTLTNCTFSGNSASVDGGGMYNSNSAPVVTLCTFSGNAAEWGAGMYNSNSAPLVTDCTFEGNSAEKGGGGVLTGGSSSSPVFTNCTFSGNDAGDTGGAMRNAVGGSSLVTNCTFFGNSAANGIGMYNEGSTVEATNCILWGGSGSQISNGPDSTVTVSFSDIQGGYSGDSNIDADPLFVDAGAGDLRLQLTSPAIDAGNNDASGLAGITTDLGAHPRFADVLSVTDTGNGDPPIVDMGAYEAPPEVIFVDQDAVGTNDGQSWENALTGLQDALLWAVSGVDIWVAEGTYRPTDGTDRTISFQMKNGVAIYGGFDPTAGDVAWGDRDSAANPTILSGDIGNPGDDSDNSYHVFYHPDGTNLDSTAILDGFTITGGNGNGGSWPHYHGGGMYNYASSPTLTNCIFSANSANGSGGGMYNYDSSSPKLTNCTFSGNSAGLGGGMYNDSSSPTLTNCSFSGNSAGGYGGGMRNFDSSLPTLTNCILWGNTAGGLPSEIYGWAIVTYSDVQGGYVGTGNIDADPLFLDPGNGDLHLGPGSPCIDVGTNDADPPPYDFEGDPRIMDGNRDGTATVDMGVDEALWHPVYLPLVLKGY